MGDLKDFYLGTPMPAKDYAYMYIPVAILPPDIIEHYNLHPFIHNNHVYIEICHGMYSFPQAGKLANVQLQSILEPHRYHPCPITPDLWTHSSCNIHFTLVVDDFAICYTDHLMLTIC